MTVVRSASSVDRPAEASRREITEEHEALRALVEGLETTPDLEGLLGRLGELRELLAVHFAREEAPEGLHRVVDASAPHLVGSVEGLFDEHRDFLAELDELAEKAWACLEGPVAELRRGVAELCRKLHEHEAAETLLLADAFYDDLGGGD